MSKKIFTFYSDPGHAWLCVPRSLIVQLGVIGKISHCSYQRNENVYLEEDCDAPKFRKALEASGKEFKYREVSAKKESRIRSYDSFTLRSVEVVHG